MTIIPGTTYSLRRFACHPGKRCEHNQVGKTMVVGAALRRSWNNLRLQKKKTRSHERTTGLAKFGARWFRHSHTNTFMVLNWRNGTPSRLHCHVQAHAYSAASEHVRACVCLCIPVCEKGRDKERRRDGIRFAFAVTGCNHLFHFL